VKSSKSEIHSRVHGIPDLHFEDQKLTSYSGLLIFQALFQRIELKEKLRSCFSHLNLSPIFGHHLVVLWLVVHLLIGFRKLRDRDYYRDDPMVLRMLSVRKMPDVSTISRTLSSADEDGVGKVRNVMTELVLERLEEERFSRITLDFDGSVLSTKRHAEGSAIGYNRKKKGARSYYPLFCTVAQTGQFLDVHYRSGNVHDSNGSLEFMDQCFHQVRAMDPNAIVESRTDGAFFSEPSLDLMESHDIEFTVSVPFERFAELKSKIESRQRWIPIDEQWSYFEDGWKPKCWNQKFRFLFLRQKVHRPQKEPLQLDLFIPRESGYEYKAIVTDKAGCARKILQFHNGRGGQENIFAEAKTQAQLDYIPMRSRVGNELFCLCALLAHNLTRELQMQTSERDRGTTEKRSPLWIFQSLGSIRQKLLHRAGRLTRPQGTLTLTLNGNEKTREELLGFLKPLLAA